MFRQAATVQFALVKTPGPSCDLYNRIASMLHMPADRSELSRALCVIHVRIIVQQHVRDLQNRRNCGASLCLLFFEF